MSEMSRISDQSIAARLERLPYSRWHVMVTSFLGVAIFFDGFDALSTAYVLPVLIREWHFAPANAGYLISIANVGQALGALFFGWLAERIGRTRTAQITIALYALMSLACAFTTNYQELFICRFFEGVGLGGEIPVASTYISEILRADRRGGSFLGYQIIFPVGLLGAGIIGAIVVPNFGWQWMFIIGAVPALVSLVLRRYCPESPRWLAQKGRLDEAERVMAEIERKVSHDGRDPLPPVVPIKVQPLGQRTRWAELFQGHYLRRTLVVWVLWASTYLVSQGLQSWIPTVYREVYHLSLQQSLNYAVAAPIGTVVGALLCALLIDRTGRRLWFIGAYILLVCGLLELWLVGASTAFGMMLGYAFCTLWTGSVSMSIFLYTAEIYPTRMRALGISWATFWLRLAATVGPVLVGWVLPSYGISGVFFLFSLITVIGLVAAIFMTETTKRVLEEVSP
ncbi:MAG TPA: MFS transporter [Stellaceae bacterium]|nr:MFS transporter [Stellaceae bacterium]